MTNKELELDMKKEGNEHRKLLMGINEWTIGRKKDQETKNTLTLDVQFTSLARLYIFRNSARAWELLDTQ